ncbi:hypothetical protein CTheo_8890 [Ceratobasidium theobromae]|uniref:Deacetylase sirtuin-type domain-containing protein n=1 Tax=Ceratobasidium theobromae TaxID=1582974 RepID=A0A5N5Q7B8_9AGAM|nr:hypothetical protein CTheo_8890 [Ceratobasidium theobromae]
MFNEFQRALSNAKRVTIVCGAGISTSAGIPDYRSEAGLYKCHPSELGTDVSSRELFNIQNLQCGKSLEAVGRMMAKLRIMARDATPTQGHLYIEKLHSAGRLLRCYTQNVDGIQTRGRPEISDHILELHGRNELRCHRCKAPPKDDLRELDERLLSEGIAWCFRCVERGEGGLPADQRRLRPLPPGCLLPDVVWNQDSRDHSINGQSLDQLQELDGQADMLLVIGTSIGTHGVAKIVKTLAKNIHRNQGAVVYIGKARPLTSSWAEYIDLQLESDIDDWAENASLLLATAVLANKPVYRSKTVLRIARHLQALGKKATIGPACEATGVGTTNAERILDRSPLLILICHSGTGTLLAECLSLAVTQLSKQRGWVVGNHINRHLALTDSGVSQCRCYAVVLSGSKDISTQILERSGYRLVVIYLSDYIFCLGNSGISVAPEQHIQVRLRDAVCTMRTLAEKSVQANLIMICGNDELLPRENTLIIEKYFRRYVYNQTAGLRIDDRKPKSPEVQASQLGNAHVGSGGDFRSEL